MTWLKIKEWYYPMMGILAHEWPNGYVWFHGIDVEKWFAWKWAFECFEQNVMV